MMFAQKAARDGQEHRRKQQFSIWHTDGPSREASPVFNQKPKDLWQQKNPAMFTY